MPNIGPNDWYPPESELLDPRKAARVIRDLYRRTYDSERTIRHLNQQLRQMSGQVSVQGSVATAAANAAGQAVSTPSPSPSQLQLSSIVAALQAGGSHELRVDGLSGILAAVQRAGARSGTALPPISQAHQFELFILSTGGALTLYQFEHGAWNQIAGGVLTVTACSVFNSSTINVNSTAASFTLMTYDTEEFDHNGMFSGSGGNITAPVDGIYLFIGQLFWAGNNAGDRGAILEHSGGVLADATLNESTTLSAAVPMAQQISAIWKMAAGETISMSVQQTSGGALQVFPSMYATLIVEL